jgi:hypothetical protein
MSEKRWVLKTSRREIEMYWKEKKVHWGVRMRSKLRKLDKCRMASNMGPGVFSTMGQQALM